LRSPWLLTSQLGCGREVIHTLPIRVRQLDSIPTQSPLGRVAHPVKVARTVVFLASEAPELMTGSIVDLNGPPYLRY
jgi:NAD(P)-dependent dehydrogenase (short-subunit alcohol dehydrogenase family)